MGFNVDGYSGKKYLFEGPFSNTDELEDSSGVYFITCYKNKKYFPIDVGETKNVKSRIETHDRKDCWSEKCTGSLMVAVLYTPKLQKPDRIEMEQDIRRKYIFPCGKK